MEKAVLAFKKEKVNENGKEFARYDADRMVLALKLKDQEDVVQIELGFAYVEPRIKDGVKYLILSAEEKED